MSRLTPTRHHNPCPLCQDTSGDCRLNPNGNLILCLEHHQSSGVDGWRFVKVSKNGLWGVHIRDFGKTYSQAEKAEYLRQKTDVERLKKETLAKEALPENDRHKAIKKIHKYISLGTADKEKLLARGLTEAQIQQGLFTSLRGLTATPVDTPLNLPGVFMRGYEKYIAVSKHASAIICPAFNYEGEAIGWQYRHDRQDNKYTWAKGYKSSHLANGELPITVIRAENVLERHSEEGRGQKAEGRENLECRIQNEENLDNSECRRIKNEENRDNFSADTNKAESGQEKGKEKDFSRLSQFYTLAILRGSKTLGLYLSLTLLMAKPNATDSSSESKKEREKTATTQSGKYLEQVALSDEFLKELGISVTKSNPDVPIVLSELFSRGIKPISALEGLLKPYVASCRFGLDTIGASGFNFTGSQQQVQIIVKAGGYNLVIFPVDAGLVLNDHLTKQLNKNISLFKFLGCKVAIAWWGQVSKESKDFDELESLQGVTLIDVATFREIASKAKFERFKQEELTKFTQFTPDLVLNRPRLYSDNAENDDILDQAIDNHSVVVINSAKKSGKSYSIGRLVERWKALGKPVILAGFRRILTYSQASKDEDNPHGWDLFMLPDAENYNCSLSALFDEYGSMACVVDSLCKLQHLDWSGALVILDEVDQFVNHTLTSKTSIEDVRGYVLGMINNKFPQVVNTAGKIIGADADACDLSCEWLEGTTGVVPFKIGNQHKSHHNDCYLFDGDGEGFKQILQLLFDKLSKGEICNVVADSRADLEALEIQIREQLPTVKTELVTKQTVTDNYTRQFIESPNKVISEIEFHCLMISPVGQCGISIDVSCFNNVFGLAFGVILPSDFRQLLIRVRQDVPRYLWITDKPKGKYSNDFDWEKILEDSFATDIIDVIQYQKSLHENWANHEILELIAQTMKENDDRFSDIHTVTKAKLRAKRNIVMSNYRSNFIRELEEEGYNIIGAEDEIGSDESKKYNVNLKAIKRELQIGNAISINSAQDIPIETAKNWAKKDYLKPEEQAMVDKAMIKDALPLVTLSTSFILEFILNDRWQKINATRRYWLTKNPKMAKILDTKAVNHAVRVGLNGGKFWLEDIKSNSHYLKLFEVLKLCEFIKDDLMVNQHSPALKAFYQRCKQNRFLLRQCGVKFNRKTPLMTLLRMVLKLFGHKLGSPKQVKVNGNVVRNYSVVRIIGGELWDELWNSFNYKYAKIEPVSYYFEVRKNEDEESENGFFDLREDDEAESYMEEELESVALPDGDVNKPTKSATNDNLELARLLAGIEFEPETIAKISLNNVDLFQALINLIGEKVVYTHPNRGRRDGLIMCINEETLGLWIVDDATKETVYIVRGKVQLESTADDESAETKTESELESVAVVDGDVNNSSESATNDNLELARLLAGLEFEPETIAKISLNNLDLLQALINLGGEKVVYTHPHRGRQDGMIICVNEETLGLWIVDDATKETVYIVRGKVQLESTADDESAETKTESELESVAVVDGDVNNSSESAIDDKLDLASVLAGVEFESKDIHNLSLNHGELVQVLMDLEGKEKVVYTHPSRGRQSGMFLQVNQRTLGVWIEDDSSKEIVYVEYGKVQLPSNGGKDEAKTKTDRELESEALKGNNEGHSDIVERIKAGVEYLRQTLGELPQKVEEMKDALLQAIVSLFDVRPSDKTLNKHRNLWHPQFILEEEIVVIPQNLEEEVAETAHSHEEKEQPLYMKLTQWAENGTVLELEYQGDYHYSGLVVLKGDKRERIRSIKKNQKVIISCLEHSSFLFEKEDSENLMVYVIPIEEQTTWTEGVMVKAIYLVESSS